MTTTYCTHDDCRHHTFEDLVALAAATHREEELIPLAHAALHGEVRCRHVPRRGAVNAPFPGESCAKEV